MIQLIRWKQTGWKSIPQSPKSLEDEGEEPFLDEVRPRIKSKKSTLISPICLTLANLIILATTLTFLFFSAHHSQQIHYSNSFNAKSNWENSKNGMLKEFSVWSPILDDIEIPTYPKMMNGTLFPPEWLSIGRRPPGPETDAEWEKFEIIRSHVLTKEQVIKLGKDPSTVAKYEEEYWGFGPDAYMGQMDIFHQIHCLNMLRKASFADYFDDFKPQVHDKMYWIHLHHCVDMLLQDIMCTGNTDLLTLNWMEDYDRPWPDFSVYHQCRDFDTLLQWQLEHGVDPHKFDAQKKPRDANEIPAPWLHDDRLQDLLDTEAHGKEPAHWHDGPSKGH